jgi:hypothetical protein
MNIRSAELLNQSLQNTADNLYRNRALAASMQEEAQRNAVEQSFRNAMMQHYANIEQKQAEAAGLQEQRLENEDNAVGKKYGVMQAIQDGKDAQQQIMQGLQGLSLDQKLSPAQKTQYLRQSIDSMQAPAKTAFLQNPQINALYQGQGDWDAIANLVRQHQAVTRANGNGLGSKFSIAGDNAEFDRQANQAPQQIANATAQADPNVPKDADTGKPVLPVTVNPRDAQRMGLLAGKLAAAGVPGPIPTAAGLTFGTNATVQPNITPGTPPGNNTTNSFTLAPGGISQDALANVQNAPGGPAILNSFGLNQSSSSSSSQTGNVRVQRPDGTITTIPAAHLRAALQYGYKQLTQ